MVRITVDQINKELEEFGWKLISTEYKNLDSELIFECDEGHKVYSTWKKIRTKRECPLCKQNQFKEVDQTLLPKKKGEYRILALDQATHISGWALFSDGRLLRYGTFETLAKEEAERDFQIKNWLLNMVKNWQPDLVALEGIQHEEKVGIATFAILARLQGILMNTLYEAGIKYVICHTGTWRKYCGVKGRSRADQKKSMQLLVKQWYDVSVSNDCADAIGIGHYAIGKAGGPKIESWE